MEQFIGQFGYVAVGLLIFLEGVFPPIPSEVILPMAGFLTVSSALTLPGVVLAATIGSLASAYMLRAIGCALSAERLRALVQTKPARVLGFKLSDIDRVVGWFEKRGALSVLVCRWVPGVRSLISIPAGTARMNIGLFTLYTLVGSLVWNMLLCGLGAAAGDSWGHVAQNAEHVTTLMKYGVIGICGLGIIWWIVTRTLPALRDSDAR